MEEKEAAVSEAMGRYRKMQRELEDAEERAERAEGTASTLRARSIRFERPVSLSENAATLFWLQRCMSLVVLITILQRRAIYVYI